MKRQNNRAWLYVSPAVAVMFLVGVVPLITVLNYSFHDLFTIQEPNWVGLQWYQDLVSSPRFWASFGRSLLFSTIVLAVQIPLGVAVALLLLRLEGMRTPVLLLLAVPLLVPWNMIALMWIGLLDPTHGFAGRALGWLGVGFDYKFNPLHTWIVLVVMDTWHWLGLVVVLAFAGLSSIPHAFVQAATIDGAGPLQVLRHIQLPKIRGVLAMAVLLRFTDSFMIYTEAFRLNAGGPQGATTFLSLDLGEEINGFSYGPAAARSVVYFLMILTFAWVFRTVMAVQDAAPPRAGA